MKTSVQLIDKVGWKAVDALRGQALQTSRSVLYVVSLIFLKFCIDLKKESLSESQAEAKPAWKRLKIPRSLEFEDIVGAFPGKSAGILLDQALERIESQNQRLLAGCFQGLSFNRELVGNINDERPLLSALVLIAELDLRPSALEDINTLSEAFELLSGRLGEGVERIYVPPGVASVLAGVIEPQGGESIYDPVCGSGMLLARMAREVRVGQCPLVGNEKNLAVLSLCKMNLVLHGVEASIERRDPITDPIVDADGDLEQFDVVIGNPPFGLKWDRQAAVGLGPQRFWRGMPPPGRGEYAFITHMVESARKDGGRVGVIVPLGVLFRAGAEAVIRERFVEENILKAVIELPLNLFRGTGVPVALLFFERGRDSSQSRILIVDARSGYVVEGGQNRLRSEDVANIIAAVKSASDIGGYSRWVDLGEIRRNQYNLSVSRYFESTLEHGKGAGGRQALEQEVEALEAELGSVQDEITSWLKKALISSRNSRR